MLSNEMSGFMAGLITDNNSELLRQTFDCAIAIINSDLNIPLMGYHEEIEYGNTMQGFSSLCKLMQVSLEFHYYVQTFVSTHVNFSFRGLFKTGVGAVIGPAAKQTSAHLMSVCDSKDLPYIYSHLSDVLEGFNLHPNSMDITKALHSIITEFEWTRFIFLYENSEYLGILNNLMSFYGTKGPIISLMRYDLNLNGNFKPVLRRVRKSVDSRIVVVGSTASVGELLKQVRCAI